MTSTSTATVRVAAALLASALAGGLAPALAAGAPHWDYDGHEGAAHWGELDPAFQTCKLGQFQSPINIESRRVDTAAGAAPLRFGYTAGPATVVNNGHTVQVNLPAAGTIDLHGTAYKLLQFHFHTPSEEQIDGQHHPLVAHLVHQNERGQLAVVAVLFKLGQENTTLAPVFTQLPAQPGESRPLGGPLDAAALLPADRSHYAFTGSLTTPPCSEDVRWHVLRTPVELSAAQLASFKTLYAMNARPVQPLNDRKVLLVP